MKKAPKVKKLMGRELAFALAYFEKPNGTEAMRTAGYKGTDGSLATMSSRLLKKVEVWTFIDELNNRKIRSAIISADEVLAELSRLGSYDPAELADEEGNPRTLRQMPEKLRRAIQGVKRDKRGRPEYALASKVPALTVLAKHYKLTSDTINLVGKMTLEDLVAGSQQEPE